MDTILISLFLVVIKEVQSTEESAYTPPYRSGGNSSGCLDGWLHGYNYDACFYVSPHDVNYSTATKQCETNHSLLWSTHHYHEVRNVAGTLNNDKEYWVNDSEGNLMQINRSDTGAEYKLTNADDELAYHYVCYMPMWTKIDNHLHYISSSQDREISPHASDKCYFLSDETNSLLNWTSISERHRKQIVYELGYRAELVEELSNDLYWILPPEGSELCFTVTSKPTLYVQHRYASGMMNYYMYICERNADSQNCHDHQAPAVRMEVSNHPRRSLCIHISRGDTKQYLSAKRKCRSLGSGWQLLQQSTWNSLNNFAMRNIISEMDENKEYWVNLWSTTWNSPFGSPISINSSWIETPVIKFTIYKQYKAILQNTNCDKNPYPYVCQKLDVMSMPHTVNDPMGPRTSPICQLCVQTTENQRSSSTPVSSTLISVGSGTTGSTSTIGITRTTDSISTIGITRVSTYYSTVSSTVKNNSAFLSPQKSTDSIGGIVGGGVTACVIIVVIIVIAVFIVKRRRSRRKSTDKESGIFNNATYNESDNVIHGTITPNGITDPKTAPPAYAAISPASPRGQQKLPNDHDYEEPPPLPTKQPDIVIYDNNNVNYSEIRRVSSNYNSGLKISENGLYGGSTSGLDVNETVMKDNDVYAGSVRHNANSDVVLNRGYDGYETVMLDNEVYSGSNSDTSKIPGLAEGGDVVMKENDLYGDAINDDLKSTDPEDGLVVTENHRYGSNGNVEENKVIEGDGVAKNNEPFYFEVDPKFVKP